MRICIVFILCLVSPSAWSASAWSDSAEESFEAKVARILETHGTKFSPMGNNHSIHGLFENPKDPATIFALQTHQEAFAIYMIAKSLGLEKAFPKVIRIEAPKTRTSISVMEFVKFASPETIAALPGMPEEIQSVAKLKDEYGALNLSSFHRFSTEDQQNLILQNLSRDAYETHVLAMMLTRPSDNDARNIQVQLQPNGKFRFTIVDLNAFFTSGPSIRIYPTTFSYSNFSAEPFSDSTKTFLLDLDPDTLVKKHGADIEHINGLAKSKAYYQTSMVLSREQYSQMVQNTKAIVKAHPDISMHDLYFVPLLDNTDVIRDISGMNVFCFSDIPLSVRKSSILLSVGALFPYEVANIHDRNPLAVPEFKSIFDETRGPPPGLELIIRHTKKFYADIKDSRASTAAGARPHSIVDLYERLKEYCAPIVNTMLEIAAESPA